MDPPRVQRKVLGRSAPGRSRKASWRRRQRSHLRPKWPESADSEKGVPGGRRADPCEVLRTGPGTQHALTSRRLGHARMHSRTHSADVLGSAKHQGHRGNTRDRPPRLRSGETIKQWINKCVSAGQAATGPDRPTGRAKRSLFGAFILRLGARCVSSRPLSADGPRRPLCQPSVGEREAAVPRTRIGASPLTRTAGGPWPGGPDSLP